MILVRRLYYSLLLVVAAAPALLVFTRGSGAVAAFVVVPPHCTGGAKIVPTGSSALFSSSSLPHQETTTNGDDTATTTYEEQEEMLVQRGIFEESLMATIASNCQELKANKPKGVGSSGGFGSKTGAANSFSAEGQAHAQVLSEEGVVRIDNVLPGKVADQLREFVYKLRDSATESIENGSAKQTDHFANVLLNSNRCDLKVPLEDDTMLVAQSLYHLLCLSPVSNTMKELLGGDDALMHELACLISDPGSQRQVVHPDNPFMANDVIGMSADATTPSLTCFVALQDIDISMGPTVWIPGTNTREAHKLFRDDQISLDDSDDNPKDTLLRTRPHVLGTLTKGSCAIFDSRVLHCGGANTSADSSRAIFYVSFKSGGNVGNPSPSIRKEIRDANVGLGQLVKDLQQSKGRRLGSKKKKKNKAVKKT